jgi:hypothetical protein
MSRCKPGSSRGASSVEKSVNSFTLFAVTPARFAGRLRLYRVGSSTRGSAPSPLCTYVPCARVSTPQGHELAEVRTSAGFNGLCPGAASPRRHPIWPKPSANGRRCNVAGEYRWLSRNLPLIACMSPSRNRPLGRRRQGTGCAVCGTARRALSRPLGPGPRTRSSPIFPTIPSPRQRCAHARPTCRDENASRIEAATEKSSDARRGCAGRSTERSLPEEFPLSHDRS